MTEEAIVAADFFRKIVAEVGAAGFFQKIVVEEALVAAGFFRKTVAEEAVVVEVPSAVGTGRVTLGS